MISGPEEVARQSSRQPDVHCCLSVSLTIEGPLVRVDFVACKYPHKAIQDKRYCATNNTCRAVVAASSL